MTEQPPEGGGTPLLDAFTRAMGSKAESRAPGSVRGAVDRYGWTSRDIAREFGVSERTARRWRQQDRIPERRAAQWRDVTRRAAEQRQRDRIGRQRDRIERRGLRNLDVTGIYRVSRSRYRARRNAPLQMHASEGTHQITGAQMRDVFRSLDEGNRDEAERQLNEALAAAYGAPGLNVEQVDSLNYTVR